MASPEIPRLREPITDQAARGLVEVADRTYAAGRYQDALTVAEYTHRAICLVASREGSPEWDFALDHAAAVGLAAWRRLPANQRAVRLSSLVTLALSEWSRLPGLRETDIALLQASLDERPAA